MNKLIFFTNEQGILLIQLLLAHIVSDFILQTKKIVENKKWISWEMLLHIGIVYIVTALFSGLWIYALLIAAMHYLIDGLKITAKNKSSIKPLKLFLIDQVLHIIVLLLVWAWHFNLITQVINVAKLPLVNYTVSLLVLSYVIIIWPVAYIVDFALKLIVAEDESNNENVGKLIGMFERIIILTFVLLSQYEAIGFLITGKSILRFATNSEPKKSEYVLLGTMLSYGISIVSGLVLKWLLHF